MACSGWDRSGGRGETSGLGTGNLPSVAKAGLACRARVRPPDGRGTFARRPPTVPAHARSRPPPCPRSVSPSSSRAQWVACRQFGSELEASIAVAILDGSGIPAVIRSNDSVGLFGSAFQGFSAMGVTLMVPSPALSAAQTVLAMAQHDAPGDAGDDTHAGDEG